MRGHIKQRSKGSWSIVLDLGRDPSTGKRKQQWVTVRGTKKEAEKKLSELQHQLNTGEFVKTSKLTVREFLTQWFQDYVKTNARAATAEGYKIIVERHLIPSLGGIALAQLQLSHIQGYYARALRKGAVTVKGALRPEQWFITTEC